MQTLIIQIHVDGSWHDAASLTLHDPGQGVRGRTRFAYDDLYFFDHCAVEHLARPVIDRRAVSVATPVTLAIAADLPGWPAWTLDLMPQGVARQRIAEAEGMRADDPAVEPALLLRAGGAPIGNLRIREAWEAERQRLKGVICPPLTDRDLAERSERFTDVIQRFAYLASGSSGVQGEWPKALMTRDRRDGCWYPDPFVATEDGAEHAIVKLLRSPLPEDALIIESEAPYLEIARAFGLRVAAPLAYSNGVLRIPRFDRTVTGHGVELHGQESLVAAIGIAAFGHIGHHEDYLALIRAVSDDPAADTVEYVLRDVLNAAMGNPDNHGRNTALTKPAGGGIRLSPLYDFAPMRLSPSGIGRSTRWRCLEGRDLDPDWARICAAASFPGLSVRELRTALTARIGFLRDLPRLAVDMGVPAEVIARAFNAGAVADAIERMGG